MNRLETVKKKLDGLPPDKLAMIERVLKEIKADEKNKAGKPSLLTALAESAFDDDLPADLSAQHDHYLYGVPKRG